MGKRGPTPAPTSLKMENGTYQAYRDGGGLEPPPGAPVAPDWLNEDEALVWQSTVELLGRTKGLISPFDANAIARYCADWVEWLECRNLIETEGAVCIGEKGGAYPHPAVNMKNAADKRMVQFEAKFGMTASDRAALKLPDNKPTGVRTRARA